MPTIGITGGVACGKTTFRRMLLERVDADFFDADACARELLDSNEVVREEVLAKISADAYTPDGHPNRQVLRDLIYSDIAKKKTLEGILHPRIRERWTVEARVLSARHRIFVVDIPLLFETRAENLFDHVVTVGCSEAIQLRRLTEARKLPEELARKILASQWSLGIKVQRASHVIWNDSDPELLESQADLLATHLRRMYD